MNDDCVATETTNEVKKAISSGCRMLAIREHSEQQIRIKLIKKGFAREVVNRCIDYLYNENWLSESRFCNEFIRSRASNGQGLVRIEFELKGMNIDQELIDQQLELENIDWQQVCESTLLKKIRQSGDLLDPSIIDSKDKSEDLSQVNSIVKTSKQKIKLENFLRYRGFSVEEIKIAIKRHLSIERQEFM